MGRVLEPEFIDQYVGDHALPERSSFWMSLQSLQQRDHFREAINLNTMLAEEIVFQGFVDF